MILNRRGILLGLGASIIAAPAIVRVSSIMPVKAMDEILTVGPAADMEAYMRKLHHKLLMNSLYGKFGQHPLPTVDEFLKGKRST